MISRTRTEPPRPTRRAVLSGAAGVVAVAGCSLNNPLSEERTPAARAVRDLDPDVAVAVEAVTLIRSARTAVEATGGRHVALAPRLAGLDALHSAHLDALVDAVPEGVDTSATGTPYAVPAGTAAALARLTGAERSLHDGLLGLAVRARSGPFARLLGSMTAGISQQLRELLG